MGNAGRNSYWTPGETRDNQIYIARKALALTPAEAIRYGMPHEEACTMLQRYGQTVPVFEVSIRTRLEGTHSTLDLDARTAEFVGYRTFPATPGELVEDWAEEDNWEELKRARRIIERYGLKLIHAQPGQRAPYGGGAWCTPVTLTYGHKGA